MKTFIIMTTVFVGLAIAVELAYLRCLAEVNKMHFRLPRRVRRVEPRRRSSLVGRPDLDFDLHVRKIDKVRFGDEA